MGLPVTKITTTRWRRRSSGPRRRSSGPPVADAIPMQLPGTGDPEKLELRRIVNRLLALEERRALSVRPVEHAVPHKVKLPGFWEKDVAAWFRLTEAVMEDNQVVQQRVMYSYRTVLLNIRTTCWRGPGAF